MTAVKAPLCTVAENADGTLTITVGVDEAITKRLKLRAQTMPLERYIWENILKRAFVDHVY
jgi:hypothetical protein